MAKGMQKMLKQAQKMQAQMLRAQEELKTREVEGTAGGGMVKVTMNGGQEVLKVSINPEVVDPKETEMLEDLVMAALKNAQEKVAEMTSSAMGGITAGMKIPGLG
jgi:DNA-binding YbaB/EbfC family protein